LFSLYYKEGEGSLAISLQSKSLDIPELLHVGGEGLFVNKATGITCDKLQTIDGTLQIKSATSLSQETLSMEKLETLHGVVFDGLTKFTDYFLRQVYRKRNDYGGKLERDEMWV